MFWILLSSIVAVALIILGFGIYFIYKNSQKTPIDPLAGLHIEMTPQLQQDLENRVRKAFQARIDEATSGFGAKLAASSQAISEQLGTLSAQTVEEEMTKFKQTLATVRSTSEQATAQLNNSATSTLTELKATSETTGSEIRQASQKIMNELQSSVGQTMTAIQQAATSTLEQLKDGAAGTVEKIAAEAESRSAELHQNMQAEVQTERALLVEQFNAKMADILTAYLAEALGSQIDLGAQQAHLISTLESRRDDIKRDLLGEA